MPDLWSHQRYLAKALFLRNLRLHEVVVSSQVNEEAKKKAEQCNQRQGAHVTAKVQVDREHVGITHQQAVKTNEYQSSTNKQSVQSRTASANPGGRCWDTVEKLNM